MKKIFEQTETHDFLLKFIHLYYENQNPCGIIENIFETEEGEDFTKVSFPLFEHTFSIKISKGNNKKSIFEFEHAISNETKTKKIFETDEHMLKALEESLMDQNLVSRDEIEEIMNFEPSYFEFSSIFDIPKNIGDLKFPKNQEEEITIKP